MKKLIALALSVVLALGAFAGCGSKEATTAKVIEIDLTSEEYAFGVDKTQPELLEKVNAFINKIKTDTKVKTIVIKVKMLETLIKRDKDLLTLISSQVKTGLWVQIKDR